MAAVKKKPLKTGDISGRITNLKQSILETFDIYVDNYSSDGCKMYQRFHTQKNVFDDKNFNISDDT
jgi:hypothetical protein